MARRNKKKLTTPASGTSGMPQAAYADTLLVQQNDPVGRGHVPAVREAANGTAEPVCTNSAVPARGGDMSPPYNVVFCFFGCAFNC